MTAKKRETAAQKKARLDAIQVVLTQFGQRIISAKNLYVVGPMKERRNTRKGPESPVTTNGVTEYAQANYRDANGLEVKGPGSKAGAGVFKAIVGLRQSVDSKGKPVLADKRMEKLLSMGFARLLPSGVQMLAAFGFGAIPDEMLAEECQRRFGEQAQSVYDYIKACIALTAAVTELTASVKTSDKSGPVIL